MAGCLCWHAVGAVVAWPRAPSSIIGASLLGHVLYIIEATLVIWASLVVGAKLAIWAFLVVGASVVSDSEEAPHVEESSVHWGSPPQESEEEGDESDGGRADVTLRSRPRTGGGRDMPPPASRSMPRRAPWVDEDDIEHEAVALSRTFRSSMQAHAVANPLCLCFRRSCSTP